MMKIVTIIILISFSGSSLAQSEYTLEQEALAELGLVKSKYQGVIVSYDHGDGESGIMKKIMWTSEGKLDHVAYYHGASDEIMRRSWIYDDKGNVLAEIWTEKEDSDTIRFNNLYEGDVLIRSEQSKSSWTSFDYEGGRLEKTTNYNYSKGCGWIPLLSPKAFHRDFECGVTETMYTYDSSERLTRVISVRSDSLQHDAQPETVYERRYIYENSELIQVIQKQGGLRTIKQFSSTGRIKSSVDEYDPFPTSRKYSYRKSRVLEKYYTDGEHLGTYTWELIVK
jgi:hypothetical protein